MGSGYPADACGAICLSFRDLVRPSQNIRTINLEMIQKYFQSEKSSNFCHYFDLSVPSVFSLANVFLSPKIPGSAKSSTFNGLSPIKS
jgi:hypothetical protein